MKKVLVKLNCHPYTVEIWFTNSPILYCKQVSKIRCEPADLDSEPNGMVSTNHNRTQMVVGLFDACSATLVHELSHAVINLFEAVGMDVNTHTTEAFAYLLDSLYQQCTNHLNEWSRR